jgi:hypothetical protein
MTDLAVITPSRGRPEQLRDLVKSIYATAGGSVVVWVGLDTDDPTAVAGTGYFDPRFSHHHPFRCRIEDRRSLSAWTNLLAAEALAEAEPPRYLASLGDDHRPRTRDWDLRLIDAIESTGGPGIAYGNDLYQGERLPTAWIVSAEIVRTVGWMMPPGCAHLYVDNAVLELGLAAGCITYRPDVVIEHLHPNAGKAAMDDSYRATNAAGRYRADRMAFEQWCAERLADDVVKVKALRG